MPKEKPKSKKLKVIVIAGPTASGKTEASLTLAGEFGGAILSCDSRQIYADLDVATDKILTTAEIEGLGRRLKYDPIPYLGIDHYGLNIAKVTKTFTLYDWQKYAFKVIQKITAGSQLPFLVGGTGLYIQAVIGAYQLREDYDAGLRQELNKLNLAQLQKRLQTFGPEIYKTIDSKNPRRLIRAIEKFNYQLSINNEQKRPKAPIDIDSLVLAFRPDRELIRERITARVARHQELGVINEVRQLVAKYGPDNPILNATISIQEYIPYVLGQISLEAAQQQVITNNYQYAKRQLTWFDKYGKTEYCTDIDEMRGKINKFVR